jgi:hypothetical protein
MFKLPIVSDIISSIAGVINNCTLSSEEKEKLKAKVNYAVLDHYDKIAEMQRDIITAEAKGNWLQRSWRPIIMLTFATIVVSGIFVDIPLLKDSSPFWDVLELGLGGYVLGRSAEKITTTMGKHLRK